MCVTTDLNLTCLTNFAKSYLYFDGSINLWSSETLKLLHTFRDGSSSVLVLALSLDGKTLASSNEDGTIHIWQINNCISYNSH
ncbi:WD40 repeat domain-containing protein [Nostoc sp. XA010]|uniref:WD40 repeat domain-containing protein n=1 Tax=Nostoc sp. XA010 TaxID=2780407 RepID=UPI0035A93375